MKIIIRLDERLLAKAKKRAAETGQTLTALLEDALREALACHLVRARRKPVRLKTVKGDGIRPGVNLDNTAALFNLMES